MFRLVWVGYSREFGMVSGRIVSYGLGRFGLGCMGYVELWFLRGV